ncbi:unnamed protein product, partial [Tetraodon nigroviridis]
QTMNVYLRVRPFSQEELSENQDQDCIVIETNQMVTLTAPKGSATMKSSEKGVGTSLHKFSFSQIFGPETTQAELFEHTVKNQMNGFLGGKNALIFSYGVTNAGKTHTIQGTPKDPGILPRVLDATFQHIEGRQYEGMDLKPYLRNDAQYLAPDQVKQERSAKATILASVKEKCDLPRPGGGSESLSSLSSSLSSSSLSSEASGKALILCSHPNKATKVVSRLRPGLCRSRQRPVRPVGGLLRNLQGERARPAAAVPVLQVQEARVSASVRRRRRERLRERCSPGLLAGSRGQGSDGRHSVLADLRWVNIQNREEAFKLLHCGNKNRHAAATKMNQSSSRRQVFFCFVVFFSKFFFYRFSLCDLAGSERCSRTKTFGERLKEAGNINSSLLILGKCITALHNNQTDR